MKFLCPNCRAKYQIADERVAGRSVKMKCRKCGHVIRITGPGSETMGAAGSVPPPSGSAVSERAPAPSSLPPPRAPQAESSAPAEKSADRAGTKDEGRSESASPPRAEVKRRPEIHATLPSRSKAGVHTAEAGDAPSSSSPPASGGVAQSLREAAAALGGDAPAAGKSAEEESGGALVGAFAQAVSAADAGVGDALAAGASDWYIGINNVPVGPVRMSQLHSKAAAGAVRPDSMVWREGFEDWQPLRSFPELLAVVEDAQASASSESLAATIGAGGAPGAAVSRAEGDGGAATSVAGAGALDDVLAAVPRRGRSPKAAWLAVVVALVFGLTVGFVMFGGKGTVETVVKYVEVPAKDEQRAAGEQAKKASDESDEDEAEGEEQKVAAKGTRRVAKGGKAAPAAAAGDKDTNASGGGLKGLRALGGVQSGPKNATGETSQASTSGRPLDSGQVQRTVARYTGSVKRSCWQPALSARDKNAPSTARVSVSIQVAPAGNVQSATSSGDPRGYRGLASCITSRVRAWRFPASSGETTVNVPFVFAAQ